GGGAKIALRPHIYLRTEVRDYITPFPKELITPAPGSKFGACSTTSCQWWESATSINRRDSLLVLSAAAQEGAAAFFVLHPRTATDRATRPRGDRSTIPLAYTRLAGRRDHLAILALQANQ